MSGVDTFDELCVLRDPLEQIMELLPLRFVEWCADVIVVFAGDLRDGP